MAPSVTQQPVHSIFPSQLPSTNNLQASRLPSERMELLKIRNVALFRGSNFDFFPLADLTLSVNEGIVTDVTVPTVTGIDATSASNGLIHSAHDSTVVELDAGRDNDQIVVLPGFINPAVVAIRDNVPSEGMEKLEDMVLESLAHALRNGTTSAAVLVNEEDTERLSASLASKSQLPDIFTLVSNDCATTFNGKAGSSQVTYNSLGLDHFAVEAKREHVNGHAVNGSGSKKPSSNIVGPARQPISQLNGSLGETKAASALSTGNILINSTNQWKDLEHRYRSLLSDGQEVDEIDLIELLRSVTHTPAHLLGLKSRGVIEKGYSADLIFLRVPKGRQTSAKSLLQILLRNGNDPSRIVSVFRRASPVFLQPRESSVVLPSAAPHKPSAQQRGFSGASSFVGQIHAMVLDRYYSRSLKKNSAALDGANGVGTSEFDKIEDAVAEYEKGNFVIAVDNEDRENEGDLLIAAEDMTPEKMAFMIRYTSGVICVSTAGDRLDELDLPLMVERNTESLKTAYTITVDYKHGTTTGISAADRSSTVRALADPSVQADDFSRPGHVFPLRYNPGGVLARVGHTEAGVDLAKLAGKKPCAALSEIVLDDGRMARRDDLRVLAKQWGLKMITIKDLIEYRVRMGLTDPKW